MGTTQEDMARYLGIATSTLRLFEQGGTLSPRLQAKVLRQVQEMDKEFPEIGYSRDLAELFYQVMERTGPPDDSSDYDVMQLVSKMVSLRDKLQDLVNKTVSPRGRSKVEDTVEVANLAATISPELLERFNLEKQARKLTSSQLLELILKYYYDSLDIIRKYT